MRFLVVLVSSRVVEGLVTLLALELFLASVRQLVNQFLASGGETQSACVALVRNSRADPGMPLVSGYPGVLNVALRASHVTLFGVHVSFMLKQSSSLCKLFATISTLE